MINFWWLGFDFRAVYVVFQRVYYVYEWVHYVFQRVLYVYERVHYDFQRVLVEFHRVFPIENNLLKFYDFTFHFLEKNKIFLQKKLTELMTFHAYVYAIYCTMMWSYKYITNAIWVVYSVKSYVMTLKYGSYLQPSYASLWNFI